MIWSKTPWVAVAPTHNVQDLERTHNATVALQEITMTQKHPHRQRNVVSHYSPQNQHLGKTGINVQNGVRRCTGLFSSSCMTSQGTVTCKSKVKQADKNWGKFSLGGSSNQVTSSTSEWKTKLGNVVVISLQGKAKKQSRMTWWVLQGICMNRYIYILRQTQFTQGSEP